VALQRCLVQNATTTLPLLIETSKRRTRGAGTKSPAPKAFAADGNARLICTIGQKLQEVAGGLVRVRRHLQPPLMRREWVGG
jgi:hypothetical protein